MTFFVRCAAGVVCVLAAFGLCAGAAEEPEVDARLSKAVTLEGGPLTLEAALARLTEVSGVTLRADPDSRQWKVSELPVMLSLRDVPLKDAQAQIARLLDLRWARSGAGPAWTYTIWQDANAREREAKALVTGEEQRIAEATGKWTSITDAISAASSMSASDLDKEAATKPFLKFVTGNEFGRAYGGLLTGVTPAAVPALAAGEMFRAPYRSLPRAARENVRTFVKGMGWFMAKVANLPETSEPSNWDSTSVVIRPIPAGADRGVMDRLGLVGFMMVEGASVAGPGGSSIPMAFPIVRPDSEMGTLIATAALRLESGANPGQVMRDIGSQAGEAARRTAAAPPAAEAWSQMGAAAAPDPRLLKEIELKDEAAATLDAGLNSIAAQTGLPVYAEGWSYRDAAKADKGKAIEVLERICTRIGAEWVLEGGALRIRAKDWAARRAAMVSSQDLAYWKSRLGTDGDLTLSDLAAIAAGYTPEQIAHLRSSSEGLRAATRDLAVPERRGALRLYGLLSQQDLALARSDEGLSAAAAGGSARDVLAGIAAEYGIREDEARVRVVEEDGASYLELSGASRDAVRIALKRASSSAAPQPRNN